MTLEDLPNMDPDAWRARASEEVGFWQNWIRTEGAAWPEGYKRKTDPNAPLVPMVRNFLKEISFSFNRPVKILDIGSGPLSYVGTRCADYDVDLTVVDPLAAEYNKLLDEKNVTGVQRPEHGFFETAVQQFGTNTFDVVWCFNSLDHSIDPVAGLFNLLSVCRIGGGMILSFHPNEADEGGYQGLHQWNLDFEDGDMIVSQKGRKFSLMPLLRQQSIMALWRASETDKANDKGRVYLRVKKTSECNLSQAVIA